VEASVSREEQRSSTDDSVDLAQRIIDRYGGGVLSKGSHRPPSDEPPCQLCAREAAYLCGIADPVTLDLPPDWRDKWTDNPEGSPTDAACRVLNDALWSSDEARTEACLPLVSLREASAAPGWVGRYIERTIREVLPLALRAAAAAVPTRADSLEAAAVQCERDGDRAAAGTAERAAATVSWASWAAAGVGAVEWAARSAELAGRAAWATTITASRAAMNASAAVTAAAEAAGSDAVLRRGVQILIECHRGEAPRA
jgi:hypothetical protein